MAQELSVEELLSALALLRARDLASASVCGAAPTAMPRFSALPSELVVGILECVGAAEVCQVEIASKELGAIAREREVCGEFCCAPNGRARATRSRRSRRRAASTKRSCKSGRRGRISGISTRPTMPRHKDSRGSSTRRESPL